MTTPILLEPVIAAADIEDLRRAKHLLENPGLAAKATNLLGGPLERGLDRLPTGWRNKVFSLTGVALKKAVHAAIYTLGDEPGKVASNRLHKLGVGATGAVGGFFGMAALAVELPISTTIMLRSVADIARANGESLADDATKYACIEVFALGGDSRSDDGAEAGYYMVRAALAKVVSDATEFAARKVLTQEGLPILIKLITEVSKRFGVQVTQKVLAQSIPAIGAAGGAAINTLFMNHFQDMATGHFTIRRLERKYGEEVVRELYGKI